MPKGEYCGLVEVRPARSLVPLIPLWAIVVEVSMIALVVSPASTPAPIFRRASLFYSSPTPTVGTFSPRSQSSHPVKLPGFLVVKRFSVKSLHFAEIRCIISVWPIEKAKENTRWQTFTSAKFLVAPTAKAAGAHALTTKSPPANSDAFAPFANPSRLAATDTLTRKTQ